MDGWNECKNNKTEESENRLLESYYAELPEGTEVEKGKKRKVLRNAKKTLPRNRDFKHVTQNIGKGKKFGLRSAQDEDEKVCHKKEKIE